MCPVPQPDAVGENQPGENPDAVPNPDTVRGGEDDETPVEDVKPDSTPADTEGGGGDAVDDTGDELPVDEPDEEVASDENPYGHTGGVPLVTGEALEGECPDGYNPRRGQNTNFMVDGVGRQFEVVLPSDTSTPRPVFLSMTGTVESEQYFAYSDLQIEQIVARDWIVLIPYRLEQDDGRWWPPWYDGVSPPSNDEGTDIRFFISAVKCAATKWSIDAGRIYMGGVSAGGTITNRALTFASDFFAGGIIGSGNWYEGGAIPATPIPMDHVTVINVWGGPTDQWPSQDPLAIYDIETRQAAKYYASMEKVTSLACTHGRGHIWPRWWNQWMIETLEGAPKGTDPATYTISQPSPGGMTCVLGEYQDH